MKSDEWTNEEYKRIQAALLAYSERTTKIIKGNKRKGDRCQPNTVLEYAVKRFGQGAREEEIKGILLYGIPRV
jgi:hypothetical protein